MKKAILSLTLLLLSATVTFAHRKKHKSTDSQHQTINTLTPVGATPAPVAANIPTSLKVDDMSFSETVHNFGTVEEGPDAVTKFTFVNNGKEPIIIEKAHPSCGCTVPSFSSEPVPPGGTGTINVAYHTRGKPTPFTKTISVVSNAGTKMLTIKGTVEKAPSGSVPENTSMVKTN